MELRLTACGAGLARFEAINDRTPDLIEYRLTDDGTLEVDVTGVAKTLRFTS